MHVALLAQGSRILGVVPAIDSKAIAATGVPALYVAYAMLSLADIGSAEWMLAANNGPTSTGGGLQNTTLTRGRFYCAV